MTEDLTQQSVEDSIQNIMTQTQQSLEDLDFDYEDPPPISHISLPQSPPLEKESSISSSIKSGKSSSPTGSRSGDEVTPASVLDTPALLLMRRQSLMTVGTASSTGSHDEESLSKTRSSRHNLRSKSSKFRRDRDAFLERSKNRSWSNMSGYDSGPKRIASDAFWGIPVTPEGIYPHRRSIGEELEVRSCHSRFVSESYDLKPTASRAGSKGINPQDFYSHYLQKTRHISGRDKYFDDVRRNHPMQGNDVHITEPNFLPDDIQAAPPVNYNKNSRSILVKPRSQRTKVSFSTVEVRQYERILGDNPGVSCGPPISIGWTHFKDRTANLSVDDYEYYRRSYRDDCDMILSREEREEMLLDLGFDHKQIAKSVRINYKLKRNRRQTLNNLSAMPVEEAVENAKKVVSRMFQSKKKRQHWKKFKEWNTQSSISESYCDFSISTKDPSLDGNRGILKVPESGAGSDVVSVATKTTLHTNANTTSPAIDDQEETNGPSGR